MPDRQVLWKICGSVLRCNHFDLLMAFGRCLMLRFRSLGGNRRADLLPSSFMIPVTFCYDFHCCN